MLDETRVKKFNINTIAPEKFHVLCNNFDPFFNWNLTTTQAFFYRFYSHRQCFLFAGIPRQLENENETRAYFHIKYFGSINSVSCFISQLYQWLLTPVSASERGLPTGNKATNKQPIVWIFSNFRSNNLVPRFLTCWI